MIQQELNNLYTDLNNYVHNNSYEYLKKLSNNQISRFPIGILNKGNECWFNSLIQLFGRFFRSNKIKFKHLYPQELKVLLESLYFPNIDSNYFYSVIRKKIVDIINHSSDKPIIPDNQMDQSEVFILNNILETVFNNHEMLLQFDSMIKCDNCNKTTDWVSIPVQNIIHLNVQHDSIQIALNNFLHNCEKMPIETIIDITHSPICTQPRSIIKCTKISQVSNFLCLICNVSTYDRATKRKKFYSNKPEVGIDFELQIRIEKNVEKFYLIGITQHYGLSPDGGHYVTHLRFGDKWILCNDSSITPTEPPKTIFDAGKRCYMLLYEKIVDNNYNIEVEFTRSNIPNYQSTHLTKFTSPHIPNRPVVNSPLLPVNESQIKYKKLLMYLKNYTITNIQEDKKKIVINSINNLLIKNLGDNAIPIKLPTIINQFVSTIISYITKLQAENAQISNDLYTLYTTLINYKNEYKLSKDNIVNIGITFIENGVSDVITLINYLIFMLINYLHMLVPQQGGNIYYHKYLKIQKKIKKILNTK